MSQFFKYVLPCLFVVGIIITYSVMSNKAVGNEISTKEVTAVMESALMGELRQGNFDGVNKKEAIGNLIADIVNTQKHYTHTARIDYVFLDKDNKPTEVEEDITQLQFQVSLYDRHEKRIQSTTAKRLTLDVWKD